MKEIAIELLRIFGYRVSVIWVNSIRVLGKPIQTSWQSLLDY